MKTLLEERIIESSATKKPTSAQIRIAREFDIDIINLSKLFTKDLILVFAEMGREVERIAIEVLGFGKGRNMYIKDEGGDAMASAMIAEEVNISDIENSLDIVYKKHYTRIMKQTSRRLNSVMDLSFLTNEREAEILGRTVGRVGLLDLEKGMKRSIARHLRNGREEGESVAQLARRLRKFVPAGRFNKAQTRAVLIARTETTRAQTFAAAEIYKENNVSQVLIMDSRKGSFDAECDGLNGRLVSLQEGEALMADEHPNGTRRMVAQPPDIE